MQCTSYHNFLHKKIPYLHALQGNGEMGVRYLDPKYSRWISVDPALGEYVLGAGKANTKDAGSLPGMGGVFNTVNLNLFHYAGNNPVKYVDPDGRELLSLGIAILTADPDNMDRYEARQWIYDNVIMNNSIPVCQKLYSLGMLSNVKTYDYTSDIVFTNELSQANNYANNTIQKQIKAGKVAPDSLILGETAFSPYTDVDLYGALGGGCGFTWNVESVNESTRTARVRVYLEDTFDFNESDGKRTFIGEKLTAIGRKAELSNFKIEGYYYMDVKLSSGELKKITEALNALD